jgi:hypothetical protein
MSIPDFLRPRLVGKRFEGHSIPLGLLGDLAVLEAMVIEVAKWRYLQDNPNRKRSPRKFTEGISLTLTSVEQGSAVAVIALSLGMGNLLQQSQQDYFEQARDAIVRAIGAAAENKPPTLHLPQRGLAYFDRLGRSLLDGEAIEFPTGSPDAPASLTKETRLRLLRAAEVTERTEEVHLRGGIHAVNQEELTFEIMLPDGSKVPGPISKPHFETIMDASYGYRQGVKVQLDGVGNFNRSERLQKIEAVEHVTLLDPLDFQSQLEELKVLKDGWLDGRGYAPPAEGLDWLAKAFNEHYSDNLNLPYVYPVAEGGVRFEWSIGPQDVSLEIDLRERSGEWHSLDLETDDEEAQLLKLDTKDGWEWIVERLQTLSGAAS